VKPPFYRLQIESHISAPHRGVCCRPAYADLLTNYPVMREAPPAEHFLVWAMGRSRPIR
jgi:hypothetical protein